MIKLLKGNDFSLKIPLQKVTVINGVNTVVDYNLSSDDTVTVYLCCGTTRKSVDFTYVGNVITIPCSGLLLGTYSVEIVITKLGGHLRSYKLNQFQIVNSNGETNLPSDSDFSYTEVLLSTSIMFTLGKDGEKGNKGDKGDTGNGIKSITKSYSTDLVDTYTILFTDMSSTTFNVKNGAGLEFTWDDTRLGIRTHGDSSYTFTELKGRDAYSPKIVDKIWWTYNDTTGQYENTGIDANPTYILTKEKVEAVLTGNITSHTHNYLSALTIGSTLYNVTSNGITIPAYPTTLPASDVYDWAKQSVKPSYNTSEISEGSNLYFTNARAISALADTLSGYSLTSHTHSFASLTSKPTTVSGYGITDLSISNGVITIGSNTIIPLTQHQDLSAYALKTYVDGAISSVYKPAGSSAFASLPTPSSSVLGNVYNVTDSFTASSLFIEGAGNTYPAGTNVVVILSGSTYMYDVLAGFVDLSSYQKVTDTIDGSRLTGSTTINTSGNAATASSVPWAGITSKPTTLEDVDASIATKLDATANAVSATKLNTARTITVGNQAHTFDGTSDISYSLEDIGVTDTRGYGVEWDTTVSSPDGTRIGNLSMHRTLPVQNLMRGVLLDDNGKETLLLGESSWLDNDRTGASGQVMVRIPNYYYKCVEEGTKFRFYMSDTKIIGYNQFFPSYIEYIYVSAYEAGIDRTNLKLTSIVNSDAQYRGGDNTDWDGTYRTLINRPVTSLTRTQFRTYARARNGSLTSWNEYLYTAHVMISWLFFVEYATLNSQKDYNAALDSNGYKQGGLGTGVTQISSWDVYNGYRPFVPQGHTDSLGNGTGIVTYNALASDNTATYYAAPVPRYRGIQNPFGHIWKWTDGINIRGDGTTREAFVTTDTTKFSDTAYDGYSDRGSMCREVGYPVTMMLGKYADLLCKTVGGSSSTYWCDYYYTSTSVNLWGAMVGSDARHGGSAGLSSLSSDGVPATSDVGIGSRLCFIPTE